MNHRSVFITGLGAVCSVGQGRAALARAIQTSDHAFEPLDLFDPGSAGPLPAGQVPDLDLPDGLPRTHGLALLAAREALGADGAPPDAIVLGVTTGGMPETEDRLMAEDGDPAHYRLHATGSVASQLARTLGCRGPALTVSTACSSAAVALGVALRMLRWGHFERILAGGADGLCRLTYHGFGLLQLIDPEGARPLDVDRAGMTVSEGAGMLLLQIADGAPPGAQAVLAGAGMSCDAHHATAPHPEGRGALDAMRAALADAGLHPGDVDYVNLHGTGTRDNDLAESRAIRTLFPDCSPPVSSTKGIHGHTLAAAGALEAVLSIEAMAQGLVPPNARCAEPDPALGLVPAREPVSAPIEVVLSNSLGFGGNNASIVLTSAARPVEAASGDQPDPPALRIASLACLTGAGLTGPSLERLARGEAVMGVLDGAQVVAGMPPRAVRRIKRLSRLALALGREAAGEPGQRRVDQVHFGTGWGPLSETHDFLTRLFASPERLASPTDFVGSVHNAPAGQLAIRHAATGPSATATGADASFEQALWMAQALVGEEQTVLLVGADEHHEKLSPLFDASVAGAEPSDGGAAFLLSAAADGPGLRCLALSEGAGAPCADDLLPALGGAAACADRVAAVFVDLPAALRETRAALADEILGELGLADLPRVDTRRLVGEFASASAVGCALAAHLVSAGHLPAGLGGDTERSLSGRGILHLNLGAALAAVEILP